MRPTGWGGVRDGTAGLAGLPVTSSFHTLSAVCSGKILVFIQYIISIESRFYGSLVYTFWCLVLSPLVTARIELQRSEKCLRGIERCERRRN